MDLINKKPWLLYVLLFFLPPVGLFFLYKMKKFNKPVRAILTVVFAFIFMIELAIPFTDSEPSNASKNSAPAVAGVADPKDQADKAPADSKESEDESTTDKASAAASAATTVASVQSTTVNGNLKIHFIDVGQADSILIQAADGSFVLIDAGNNGDGPGVVSYLKSQGVKELAAVVATHPHEDHIGGMDTVIKSFPIKQVYMPNASSTTKTFEDMIAAINASGAKRIQAKPGVTLDVPGITGIFLAPNGSGYDDLNNFSAVLKLTYGSTSFLLTGDAEDVSEGEMLKNGNLQATLLKVGHHGSASSTTSAFLKSVSPKYAVVSVGTGNSYGHPNDGTMSRIAAAGVSVYRTDQTGTIIATSDGNSITINKNASSIKVNAPPTSAPTSQSPAPTPAPIPVVTSPPSNNQSITVYTTNSGEKYHVDGCRSLSKSKIPIALSDAKSSGLTPCSICKPPQ